jgi:hypothetical protein
MSTSSSPLFLLVLAGVQARMFEGSARVSNTKLGI